MFSFKECVAFVDFLNFSYLFTNFALHNIDSVVLLQLINFFQVALQILLIFYLFLVLFS